mmetsp:Transcript_9042/g.16425  ORF Transcript_9042/g.16425 Transcript_9042/m.16425 type:complete len:251 (-) Transcript_9042:397-1149(-)
MRGMLCPASIISSGPPPPSSSPNPSSSSHKSSVSARLITATSAPPPPAAAASGRRTSAETNVKLSSTTTAYDSIDAGWVNVRRMQQMLTVSIMYTSSGVEPASGINTIPMSPCFFFGGSFLPFRFDREERVRLIAIFGRNASELERSRPDETGVETGVLRVTLGLGLDLGGGGERPLPGRSPIKLEPPSGALLQKWLNASVHFLHSAAFSAHIFQRWPRSCSITIRYWVGPSVASSGWLHIALDARRFSD